MGYYTVKETVQTVNLVLNSSVGALPTYPTNFRYSSSVVEQNLDKVKVAGSIPACTTNYKHSMEINFKFENNNSLINSKTLYSLLYLLRSVEYLQGDVAEVGVYKGGSGKVLCENTKETVYLIDTFEGLPKLSIEDENKDGVYSHEQGDFNDTSLEFVKTYLKDYSNHEIIKAKWPDPSIKILDDKKFKFVHIDVDIYQSYVDNINYFWPRLIKGGIIVFDDYNAGTCPGAKKAVDEFIKKDASWITWYNKDVLFFTSHLGQAYLVKI